MLIKVKSQKSKVKSQWKFITSVLFFLFSFFYSIATNAQCAMCRAALESEGNQSKAKGINDGIVYLMVIPYLLFVIVAFAVYKMYTKKNKA
jgi:preprotein translocase subunit SecG